MPVNSHSYDDLPRVYAEEISRYHRGVLRSFRRCGDQNVYDRFAKWSPSLDRIETRLIRDEPDPAAEIQGNLLAVDAIAAHKTPRKSLHAVRRAGRRGGAATKALWALRRAAQSGRAA